jgi:hypothetical protein
MLISWEPLLTIGNPVTIVIRGNKGTFLQFPILVFPDVMTVPLSTPNFSLQSFANCFAQRNSQHNA